MDSAPTRRADGGRRTLGMPATLLAVVALVAATVAGLALVVRPSHTSAWYSATPAIRADFPDPDILVADGRYYAFATSAAGRHIQVARSPDLTQWTMLPDALPTLPTWVAAGDPRVWAPAVLELGNTYVMYYTAHDAASDRQCIGVATSPRPDGPFRDASTLPLVCQTALGGDIDPSPLQDRGRLYLYFKSDGDCCALATHIWGQELSPDGLRLMGRPVPLLTADQAWEGTIVEAPQMVRHDDAYYLFYSGNDYATARYAEGYARCSSPLGPCSKPRLGPFLTTPSGGQASFAGPGGAAIFQADDATWIAFHAWYVTSGGALGDSRYLFLGRVEWDANGPRVYAP